MFNPWEDTLDCLSTKYNSLRKTKTNKSEIETNSQATEVKESKTQASVDEYRGGWALLCDRTFKDRPAPSEAMAIFKPTGSKILHRGRCLVTGDSTQAAH